MPETEAERQARLKKEKEDRAKQRGDQHTETASSNLVRHVRETNERRGR